MSTSFPNNNGNVPPYNNPQPNGSFNQFGQTGPPGPGGFPGMDPYNMYGNNFGGMPPGQPPNMGAPPQQPGGPKGQQYPGPGAKPPGYDGMPNGYMQGYRPPNGQAAPPNYGNPYDPYRMYPGVPGGMPGPPQPAPTARPTPTPPAPAPQRPPSQAPPPAQNPYPAQQPLPAHLGAPAFPNAASGSTPLQHYQPPNYMPPPGRGTALPPLQSPNSAKPPAKPEEPARPNSFGGAFPNQPYAGFGGPSAPGSGASTPGGYPGYGSYPGFGGSQPGAPGAPGAGTPGHQGFGAPGGFNPGFGASGPGNVQPSPTPPANHFPGQNHFNGNPGTPGNTNFATPTTPGAAPTQSPLAQQPPPPNPQLQYGQNNLMSPSNNMKPPARSPMGSSLPPLNGGGQFPGAPEPTFKEPAMPIRQSPSHPPPQPPAYHAQPSTSNQPAKNEQRAPSPTFAVPTLPAAATLAQASSANQVSTKPRTSPQKKREAGVPEPPNAETPFTHVTHYELPAAMANLRDSLSLSPQAKHPNLDKYFTRKRQQLRIPYPEGLNVQTAPVTEPDTFGFMQGTKYFEKHFNRGLPTHPPQPPMHQPMGPPMPPMLARSQSMHAPMISPGYNHNQQVMQQQQPSTSGRQPAKKARSASDASEPAFNVPLPPSRQQGMRPTDPRQMQMQQQQMHYNQQQMQKMQQQQQQMAQQQYMARMAQGPSGMSPAQPGPSNIPPALQRAESMPALPSQPQMGGMMPAMNGNQKGTMPTNSTGPSNATIGPLPPLTLGNHQANGARAANNDFQSTSNHAQVRCAGCNHFIMRGSATLCCMYHACKNVYHRECTRLSPSAYSQIEQETPHARWVCPTCEPQVRPAPPPMQMQHA